MFTEWFKSSKHYYKIGFEDVNYAIQHPDTHLIINTLTANNQECLIKTTISLEIEERTINDILQKYAQKDKRIIIYGKNSADETTEHKYRQLQSLGFSEIYVYGGGIFEWVLLQDIYGQDEFPTTKTVADILQYKPPAILRLRT